MRCIAAALTLLLFAGPARAGTIVDDWTAVVPPPPPDLRAAKLDPKTTALLLLDFNGHEAADSGPCNAAVKPRCLASIPVVRALADRARARGVLVIYSLSNGAAPGDIRPGIAPAPGDPIVQSGPDKFIGTALRDILDRRGIKTVVVTGTAAEGAVLDTATDAALHGMSVVVPVDGASSTQPYAEQYVAWHLAHAPGVAQKSVVTRTSLITFD